MKKRVRGEAFAGQGYGTLRGRLFVRARHHIENAIQHRFYCEAIAVTESVISDRLESRLSYLSGENSGFLTLGAAITHLTKYETDFDMLNILKRLDDWREKRNRALHELVKVEDGKPKQDWNERISSLSTSAEEGYILLQGLYHRVADLNPSHIDRVFPNPKQPTPGDS